MWLLLKHHESVEVVMLKLEALCLYVGQVV